MQDDWTQQAECRGQNPAIFVPDTDHGDPQRTVQQYMTALSFCRQCSVVSECLEWAISRGEEQLGVYGNTTPRQRRTIREQRAHNVHR